jgi:hypothetical protein
MRRRMACLLIPELLHQSTAPAFLPLVESRASAIDSGSRDKNSSVSQSARTRLLQSASRTVDT